MLNSRAEDHEDALLPLVIDLDGTLIHSDLLYESTLKLLKSNPFFLLILPFWLIQGKAAFKRKIAERCQLATELLPYNEGFIDWLKSESSKGRSLILCSASDELLVTPVAEYLGLFQHVMASNAKTNLKGSIKAQRLLEQYGQHQFDYAGNSQADLQVWKHAHKAIVVNANKRLLKLTQKRIPIDKIFPAPPISWIEITQLFRVHQWLKNLLLFVPLFAAHQLTEMQNWLILIQAFLAYSLIASSVYIANDMLDLESDRHHTRKKQRPFASGKISLVYGALLAPCLLCIASTLAFQINSAFFICLLCYFCLSSIYSIKLKSLLLIDCIVLALLYTLRIIAGSLAVSMSLSFWFLTFSVFFFLSLAFVKRYAEFQLHETSSAAIPGRAYLASDAPIIQMFGIGAGYAAVLVLAFYLNSEAVMVLYQAPEFVWGAVAVLLFWISWMWMQAHRGNMHDDPVIFALENRISLLASLFFAFFLILGTVGLP